ncbi:uncharacterized protein LOC116413726 [Galleria mellonella]|uniref:Uncharacterized protein LOC116413726 n=1 Tax=Galleria mellonella TaxID=7137 RepID=A0ABM3MDL6_GALME|nr:uncharacterized protein LOC116413726 [Galleria mellonella]
MFKEDDDNEENTASQVAVRYPCMPSLVALQQMRNRSTLASLGRKLMKWTSLATSKELRRLSAEISRVYQSFDDDMGNAFLLLARSRYYYPNLNKMVLENIQTKASVLVTSTVKTLSGVKVTHYSTIEVLPAPYPLLGISNGGQKIKQAKDAWLDLLKRIVTMLDLRSTFALIEDAHRNATKKQNVLGKVVVPRTKASIIYINDELEEIAREEFFRLKKILEVKRRSFKTCGHEEPNITCLMCKKKYFMERDKIKEVPIEKCLVCEDLLQPEDNLSVKIEEEKTIDNKLLESFKNHVENIVNMTKDIKDRGIITTNIEQFLKTAEELSKSFQRKSENVSANIEPIISDIPLNKLCAICLKRFNQEYADKKQLWMSSEETTESKSKPEKVQSKVSPKSAVSVTPQELVSECLSKTQTDLDLGTFELEIKEIVKTVRVQNEDGSITEEKKVIKFKKEVRAPVKAKKILENQNEGETVMYQSSEVSSKSNEFCGCKSLEDSESSVYRIQTMALFKKHQSEITTRVNSMNDTKEFISSSSTLPPDNISDKFFDKAYYIDNNDIINLKLTELFTSSSDIEEVLQSFEPQNDNNASTSKGNTHTTKSTQDLCGSLSNFVNEQINENNLKSVSEPDVKKSKETAKKNTSFQIDNKKED